MLKDDANTRRIPVVALTASSCPESVDRASALGFRDFLAKPISPRDVLVHVRRLLSPLET